MFKASLNDKVRSPLSVSCLSLKKDSFIMYNGIIYFKSLCVIFFFFLMLLSSDLSFAKNRQKQVEQLCALQNYIGLQKARLGNTMLAFLFLITICCI